MQNTHICTNSTELYHRALPTYLFPNSFVRHPCGALQFHLSAVSSTSELLTTILNGALLVQKNCLYHGGPGGAGAGGYIESAPGGNADSAPGEGATGADATGAGGSGAAATESCAFVPTGPCAAAAASAAALSGTCPGRATAPLAKAAARAFVRVCLYAPYTSYASTAIPMPCCAAFAASSPYLKTCQGWGYAAAPCSRCQLLPHVGHTETTKPQQTLQNAMLVATQCKSIYSLEEVVKCCSGGQQNRDHGGLSPMFFRVHSALVCCAWVPAWLGACHLKLLVILCCSLCACARCC